jgi:hypothetical protein
VSIRHAAEVSASWNRTQLGQLLNDPVMQPFVEDLKRQIRERFARMHAKIGLTLDDVKDIAGGELSMALAQPAPDKAATIVLVDVTGHLEETKGLLAKIERNLKEQGATREVRTLESVEMIVYQVPREEESTKKRMQEVVVFLHEDLFCSTDSAAVAAAIVSRIAGDTSDNLAERPPFRAVMERCLQDEPEQAADVRWYIEPFAYIEAVRTARPRGLRKRGKDLAKILASQGFSAVQAVGGFVHFSVDDKYELVHRTAVYAPAVAEAQQGDKYLLAARMLEFPNGGDLNPYPWIPREVAFYASFNCLVPKAFDASETLVDALIGQEGAFQDILDGIREDPVGPQVDLRSELVAHLGTRATTITDYQLPITPQSERWLLALESIDEGTLAQTIERIMQSDPNAHRREAGGHVVWEIAEETTDLPELTIDSPSLNPLATAGSSSTPAQEKEGLPSSAVSVAFGHLLVASHYDFLIKVMEATEARETLAYSAEFQAVGTETNHLGPEEISFRIFTRTDESYRPTYELIRAGRMPEAETLFGRLLNELLGEEEDVIRPQQIDGSKLPDFEMVRRYLGPAGITVCSEENGWFAIGFALNKEMP